MSRATGTVGRGREPGARRAPAVLLLASLLGLSVVAAGHWHQHAGDLGVARACAACHTAQPSPAAAVAPASVPLPAPAVRLDAPVLRDRSPAPRPYLLRPSRAPPA